MTGVETKWTKTRNYFRIKYTRKTAYQAGVIIWLKYGSRSMKTSSKRYPVLKDQSIAEDKVDRTNTTGAMANSGLRVSRERAGFVPRSDCATVERFLSQFSELPIKLSNSLAEIRLQIYCRNSRVCDLYGLYCSSFRGLYYLLQSSKTVNNLPLKLSTIYIRSLLRSI